MDKIVQGNTSNIVFLKSTDDSMLDTLQKMSGTKHHAYRDSKTVTRDMEKLMMRNEGKVSYTMTTVEEPVIKYNDMAFIGERNSIVFRAGDSPIWNRNETILPMSWRLLRDTITHPGHEYTFQTIPTLSSAKDFDVRKNMPDFGKMLDKRIAQALQVDTAKEAYQTIYDYTEYEIEQLDPDMYADEIMEVVNTALCEELRESPEDDTDFGPDDYDDYMEAQESFSAKAVPNKEQAAAVADAEAKQADEDKKRYADGYLSRGSFKRNGIYTHSLDKELIAAFLEVRGDFEQDRANFAVRDGSLYSSQGVPYIVRQSQTADLKALNDASHDPATQVYGEEDIDEKALSRFGSYEVRDAFLDFLVSAQAWNFANGRFDAEMARRMRD